MSAAVEDLRRTARHAYDRTEHERLDLACREILTVDPHDSEARRLLGLAAMRDQRPDLAEPWFRETAARRPDDAAAWRALAGALSALRREGEAEAILSAAAARGVQTPGLLMQLAALRNKLGLDDGACAAYEAAIETDPRRGEAYWGLASVGGLAPGDPVFQQARSLLDKNELPEASAAPVRFALAEAERRAGHEPDFFARLLDANRRQRALLGRPKERPDAPWRVMQRRVDGLDGALRKARRCEETMEGPVLVFLIGELSSGAELAEAMLAAEPGAFAAGEINLIGGAVTNLIAKFTRRRALDEVFGLRPRQLAQVRAAYLERARRIAPRAKWFIDRSGGLSAAAPALRFLFPEAAIVRIEREGMQQGLDIFRRYWPNARRDSCDLAAIGDSLRRARRACHAASRNKALGVAVIDADALAADPLGAEPALRDAARLPPSLSTFSSKEVRRAAAELAHFSEAFLERAAAGLRPLRRGLS